MRLGAEAASFPWGSGGQRPPLLSSPNLSSALAPRLPWSPAPNEPPGSPQQQTQQGKSRSQPRGSRGTRGRLRTLHPARPSASPTSPPFKPGGAGGVPCPEPFFRPAVSARSPGEAGAGGEGGEREGGDQAGKPVGKEPPRSRRWGRSQAAQS